MKVTTISTGLALTDAGAVILSPVGVIAYVVQTDSGYRLTSTIGATLCSDATGEPLGPFGSRREAAEKAPMLLGYKLPAVEAAPEPEGRLLIMADAAEVDGRARDAQRMREAAAEIERLRAELSRPPPRTVDTSRGYPGTCSSCGEEVSTGAGCSCFYREAADRG